jgi:hypothetical protein
MPAKGSIYEKQLVREIRGTPEDYLPNLLQVVRVFRESVALKPARASFRQGWKEALAGKTRAVDDLWQRPPHGRWRVSRIDHLSRLR